MVSGDSGRAPVGRYGNADRHLRENDAIVDLGGGEICDLDTASPEASCAPRPSCAHCQSCQSLSDPFSAISRSRRRSTTSSSLNAQRIDHDWQADEADAQDQASDGEIQKALPKRSANQTNASRTRTSHKKAGAIGQMMR